MDDDQVEFGRGTGRADVEYDPSHAGLAAPIQAVECAPEWSGHRYCAVLAPEIARAEREAEGAAAP